MRNAAQSRSGFRCGRRRHRAFNHDGVMFMVRLVFSAWLDSFREPFRSETGGVTIHLRAGGQGPAVIMLHGFGFTGDMWAPVAAVLAKGHRVVIPDLRGMRLSSHPEGGYDKKTISRPSWTSQRSKRPHSSRTTSAIWSAVHLLRNFPRAGTSTSVDRMWSDWSRAAHLPRPVLE